MDTPNTSLDLFGAGTDLGRTCWVEKTWIVLMDSEEGESSNANFSYGVKLENQSFWRDTRLRNIHMAGIILLYGWDNRTVKSIAESWKRS